MVNIAKNEVSCKNVKSIEDINKQYPYEDKKGKETKKYDDPKVSCGQDDDYNELEYIYDTYLALPIALGTLEEDKALKALCETCRELKNPRKREDFYEKLSEKLGIQIP